MSVVVVALLTPRDGAVEPVLDAFREVSPAVHEEAGCEFYAAHTDGKIVMMVERWSSAADLTAHSTGAPLARLNELLDGHLDRELDVWMLDGVPMGDALKGVIPA